MIADSKLALNAGWDREVLASELQALIALGFEVGLTGFELAEVDLVIGEAAEKVDETGPGQYALGSCHGGGAGSRGGR